MWQPPYLEKFENQIELTTWNPAKNRVQQIKGTQQKSKEVVTSNKSYHLPGSSEFELAHGINERHPYPQAHSTGALC